MSKNRKLALNSGIQINQILTNDDEVCITSLSSILLAVIKTGFLCVYSNFYPFKNSLQGILLSLQGLFCFHYRDIPDCSLFYPVRVCSVHRL